MVSRKCSEETWSTSSRSFESKESKRIRLRDHKVAVFACFRYVLGPFQGRITHFWRTLLFNVIFYVCPCFNRSRHFSGTPWRDNLTRRDSAVYTHEIGDLYRFAYLNEANKDFYFSSMISEWTVVVNAGMRNFRGHGMWREKSALKEDETGQNDLRVEKIEHRQRTIKTTDDKSKCRPEKLSFKYPHHPMRENFWHSFSSHEALRHCRNRCLIIR